MSHHKCEHDHPGVDLALQVLDISQFGLGDLNNGTGSIPRSDDRPQTSIAPERGIKEFCIETREFLAEELGSDSKDYCADRYRELETDGGDQ